jgi:UDP-2,3-diacylglucosamine pyrophosphatase LpxH
MTNDEKYPSDTGGEETVHLPLQRSCAARTNFLVLSDMHLGSDIAEGASFRAPARSESVDDDLRALLDHYRDDSGPWHLIINGDFIDFIGISIGATTSVILATEPTKEERAHGLGTSEDHARVKLARVATRHHAVFTALAAFVAVGHRLTIVPGNHDREFHWTGVRDDLRAVLLGAVGKERLPDPEAFVARIEFSPWFFWAEGIAYIEHGHQYDAFCATDHMMAPLSPLDPRRLESGFGDVLLRYIVHPTRGLLRQYGHERMGVIDYLALAFGLGIRGGINLAWRFANAVAELFRLRRNSLGEAAETLRTEHDRRVSLLADATRIGLDRLRALLLLQAPPVTRSVRGILASVLLDKVALALFSNLLLLILLMLGIWGRYVPWGSALVPPAWWLAHVHLGRTRHVDPQSELLARAAPLSRLFPSAFVVMGHTHVPMRLPIDGGRATYINTGSWAEEAGEGPDAPSTYRAARTHLVIRVGDGGPKAELLAWESRLGPKCFATG